MGLFDDIRCDMPLPNPPSPMLQWQTKSLECGMNHYLIKEDGHLVDENIRMEEKPGAPPQPKFLTPEDFAWRKEWMEQKEGPEIPIDHTGEVRFYSMDANKVWWEYVAFFEGGKCFKIVRVSPEEDAK